MKREEPPSSGESGGTARPEIFGRYTLIEVLGEGGMGLVYRAMDPSLQREVALKVIGGERAATPERRARLVREARAMARLKHPGIVEVFEVGEEQGKPYFTMELIRGPTVGQLLEEGPLPALRAASIAAAVARVLAFAHARGVVHRDVKPSNIVLDPTRGPVLLDFGLAKELDGDTDRFTRESRLIGTPFYMAPELALEGPQRSGPASDQYALGLVLVEMLLGEHPFFAPTQFASLQRALREPLCSLSDLGLPRALDAVCQRACARDAADRYPDIARMAEDLEQFLANAPTNVPPIANRGAAAQPRVPTLMPGRSTVSADRATPVLAPPLVPAPSARAPLVGIFLLVLLVGTSLALFWPSDRDAQRRKEQMQARVVMLLREGDVPAARAAMESYAGAEPDPDIAPYGEAWLWWGKQLAALHRDDEARAALARAYAALPQLDAAGVLVPLAEVQHALGDLAGLAVTMQAIEERAPKLLSDPKIRRWQAEARFSRGAVDEAVALGLSPAESEVARLLTGVLPVQGLDERMVLLRPAGGAQVLAVPTPDGVHLRALGDPNLPLVRVLPSPVGAPKRLFALPRHDGQGDDLLVGTASDCALLRVTSTGATTLARWSCALPRDALREPGRVDDAFLVAEDRQLVRVIPEPGGVRRERPHPPTDAANSELLALHMDDDGGLLVGTSGWGAYDLRLLQPHGDRFALSSRARLGRVAGVIAGDFGFGPVYAAIQTSDPTILWDVRSFGPNLPHGEPAGTYFFRRDGDALVQVNFMPTPDLPWSDALRARQPVGDFEQRLFGADIDGDGQDELIQGIRGRWLCLTHFDAAGVPSMLAMDDLLPVLAADLDNDGLGELIVQRASDPTQFWVLGAGKGRLAPPPTASRVSPPAGLAPARREQWALAEDLVAMGLGDLAATRLEQLGQASGSGDIELAALERSASLRALYGDARGASALYARMAKTPGLSAPALERGMALLLSVGRVDDALELGRRRVAQPNPPADLARRVAELEAQAAAPEHVVDFVSALPAEIEVLDPLGLTPDASAGGLRHRGAGTLDLWQMSLRSDGGPARVFVDMTIGRVDWGTIWQLQLGPDQRLFSLGLFGGGEVYQHRYGCGNASVNEPLPDLEGRRVQLSVTVSADGRSLDCALLSQGEELGRSHVVLDPAVPPGGWTRVGLSLRSEQMSIAELTLHTVTLRGLTPLPTPEDSLARLLVLGRLEAADAGGLQGARGGEGHLERLLLMDALDRDAERRQELRALVAADPNAEGPLGRALVLIPDRVLPLLQQDLGQRAYALFYQANSGAVVLHPGRPEVQRTVTEGLPQTELVDPLRERDPDTALALLELLGRGGGAWRRRGRNLLGERLLAAALRAVPALERRFEGDPARATEVRFLAARAHAELALVRLAAGQTDAALEELLVGLAHSPSPEIFADRLCVRPDYASLRGLPRWSEIEAARRLARVVTMPTRTAPAP